MLLHWSVQCGKTLLDDACGNGNKDDSACSGSRRVVSAWLEQPGAVQRQDMAQATTLVG
jgi:hypothetical protein